MRKSIVLMVIMAALAVAAGSVSPSSAQSPVPEPEPDTLSSVLISVADLGRNGDADLLANRLSLSHADDIQPTLALDGLDLIAAEVTPAGAAALSRIPFVNLVEPARKFFPLLDISVPTVGATVVQSGGLTGAGKVVAVIDSGVDGASPGLVGSVVSEACFVPLTVAETAALLEGCPAGEVGPGAAAPCLALASDCSHGTHIAGVISGAGPTYIGVAPDAGIAAIRVFGIINGAGGAEAIIPESGVLQALEHVYELAATTDIVAVNLSIGAEPGLCQPGFWAGPIALLSSRGVAIVAASGNDGWGANSGTDAVSFPACLPEVISVGSTTPTGKVAGYTNSSDLLDLLAPGSAIRSTVTTAVSGSGYAEYSGTSFASPHVAAAFALFDDTWSGLSTDRRRNLLRVAGTMITRTTPQIGDRELRFPELRLRELVDFVPFSDAVGDVYWAMPADWARFRGVTNGLDGIRFGADTQLNRAQALTFLWRLMGSPEVTVTLPFGDVTPGSFYEKAVKWAWSTGITGGTSLTTFSPEQLVTRWQVAVFIWRMLGEPPPASSSGFVDVPPEAFFAAAIEWMAASGVTKGTSPLTFSPELVIPRGQMITFMFRLVNSPGAWTGSVIPPSAVVLF